MRVESAARIVSLVELTVIDFNDIWNDDQLKESGESVSAKVAAEGLHDPNELRHFQEGGRRKLMNLHRKSIQNSRKDKIAGKSQSTGEEIAEYNNFISFGSRSLFV
jgi:hypothetical protein